MSVVRVNISLPEEILVQLDAAAKSFSMDRSEYIRSLVRTEYQAGFITKENVTETLQKFPQLKTKGIKLCKHGSGPGLCKHGCK